MGVIEPGNKALKAFKGLHLYHVGKSNCAGRVRLLIEEKRVPWVSHYVDLYTKENISPEYFAINPKGVVPTVVLDGEVVVESNDILLYLEERFPKPSFLPKTDEQMDEMKAWLKRSGDIHIPGIKTYSYNKFVAKNVERSEEDAKLYKSLQKDPDLLAFHAKHDPGQSFSKQDIDNALALMIEAMADMDKAIAEGGWLVGDSYTLADISWAPSMTAFVANELPTERFEHLTDWYERIKKRPAWKRMFAWWDAPAPKEKVLEISY